MPDRVRRVGAVGLPALALAAASLEVAGAGPAPPSFRRMTIGLMLAGTLAVVLAAGRAIALGWSDRMIWPGAPAGLIALAGLVGVATQPFGVSAGAVLAALALTAAAALVLLAGDLVRPAARWVEERLSAPRETRPRRPSGNVDRILLVGAMLATLLTMVSGSAVVVAGAGILLTLTAYRIAARRGVATRWPVLLAGGFLLAVALILLLRPESTGPVGPLAPAWEVHVGLLVVLAGVVMAGLWPLHHVVPEGWLVPAAAGLMATLGRDLSPLGWSHWAPLVFPYAVLALWHGALVRRPGLLLASGTVLGFAAGGGPGAWGLAIAAVVRRLLPRLSGRPVLAEWCTRALWTGVGVAALPTLARVLEAEVVYGVAAAVGAAGAAWWAGEGRAE